jgi:hypothetical protein
MYEVERLRQENIDRARALQKALTVLREQRQEAENQRKALEMGRYTSANTEKGEKGEKKKKKKKKQK